MLNLRNIAEEIYSKKGKLLYLKNIRIVYMMELQDTHLRVILDYNLCLMLLIQKIVKK